METTAKLSRASAVNDKKSISFRLKQLLNLAKKEKASGKTNQKIIIFLVDDDPVFLKALELSISDKLASAEIKTFQTGENCLQQMKLKPSIVILDYYLNSEIPYAWNGMKILKHIKKISGKTKVIMLSSQDSLNIAMDSMENGAYDYISKSPSSLIRVNNILSNIAEDMEATDYLLRGYKYVALIILLAIILRILFNY
jgi:two-component system OmpR family response regulator